MGTSFEQDKWELFHLDRDFSETDNLAEKEPERLQAMIDEWWWQAKAHKVLPLDEAKEGLRLIRDREVIGKVVIVP